MLVDTTCDMFSHHHSKGNTRQLDSHKYSWWIQHVTCSHTNTAKVTQDNYRQPQVQLVDTTCDMFSHQQR